MQTKKLNTEDILYICNYIKYIDHHSDINNFFNDHIRGEISYEEVIECFITTMTEWKQDILLCGITRQELKIYKMLGLPIEY